ncbi:hypothetical protein [Sphingobacterium paludis]|uniref:DUF4890 domain-containing protein n=1 Tax=Sphingobacterium paludis TaxID=1476465 RepID=A0A4R7D5C9_9SPHI|nr:hypothetical protein [Sphingobacterium paludis]TDS14894.1 hypothetical protein B0I21_103395 [Sphingobacterium paludis]
MKKLTGLLVTMMFGMSMMGFAQERQGRGMQQLAPADRAKTTVTRLTEELELSSAQQDSIYKQVFAQATEEKEIFSKSSGDRQAVRQSMQTTREKYRSKIRAFLTEEQAKKYDTLQQRRPQGRAGRSS